MHTSFTQKLSQYQKAILHEMGIPLWRARVDVEAEQEQTSAQPIAKTEAVVEQQQTRSLVAIPGKLLLLAAIDVRDSKLVQDVCLAINVSVEDIVVAPPEKLQDYVDYRLAWRVAASLSVENNTLTTPALEQLTSAQQKRQLWQLLQPFIIRDVDS